MIADVARKGGRILEIGVGEKFWSVKEAKLYDGSEDVTFVDPSLKSNIYDGEVFGGSKQPKIIRKPVTELNVDEKFDLVLSVFTMCSVNNLCDSVQAIEQLLVPGGTYAYVEHVAAAEGTGYRIMQDVLSPVQEVVAGGCHLNRPSGEVVEKVFGESMTTRRREEGMWPVGEVIYGLAKKT